MQENGLNVLFNNAGASPKSTRLNFVKTNHLFDTLTVNTVAPIMLTKVRLNLTRTLPKQVFIFTSANFSAILCKTGESSFQTFLPLLKKAAKKNADCPFGVSKAAVINMSSILGSLELNTDGGLYPYRCSKVRRNTLAIQLREVVL